MISKKAHLTEVYVWQLPVRIFHWVNALCIVILCITGYIIGNPPAMEKYFRHDKSRHTAALAQTAL